MLNMVEVRTSQGGLLSLPLEDPSLGFVVQDIQGLDPVKATIVSSSFAQQDGAQYQSSRREFRNILLKLGLYPDYTVDEVSDLRKRLYAFFMPKTEAKFTFYTSDGLNVDITGRIESFENNQFTQDPVVDVSILCFDPDFVDPDVVALSGNSTGGSTETDVVYAGTVDTGILFKLNVNRTLSAFTIYHQASDGSLRTLDFAASLVSGDVVTISTMQGQKFATLTRAGVVSSILYGVSPHASWIELMPGVNELRVYAVGAGIPWTIDYKNRYGGL
jgi:hypothetical protein